MEKDVKRGYLYGLSAFVFWGFIPIYFKSVSHMSPFEVLSHRILWSVVFLWILVVFAKQSQEFWKVIRDSKKLKMLFISAVFISLNWLIFIWAITSDKILEASFGYFINPLVNMAFGFVFFNERLSKNRYIAVFLAVIGVSYQILVIGYLPFISLALALLFSFYGLVRKKIAVASMPGLLIETILMLPFALGYMIYLDMTGVSHFGFLDISDTVLLILAGVVTAVPLVWFNVAASKLPLSTIGFLQYIAPSIAFLIAIFVYNEPFSTHKLISFAIIWLALVFYTIDLFLIKKKS